MVCRRCQFVGIFAEAFALCLYESLHNLVAQIAAADHYGASLPEQRRGAFALQAEEAPHGSEIQLFRLSSGKDGFNYRLEVGTDSLGLGYEVLRTVGAVFPRFGRKMFLLIGIVVAVVGAQMGCDTFARVIDAHLRGRKRHIHLLPDETVRNGVRVAIGAEGYETVRRYLQRSTALELEGTDGQRRQHRLLGDEEALPARVAAACKVLLVRTFHKLGYGSVELLQRVADSVAQRRVYVAVCLVDSVLYQYLVLRPANSCRLCHT